MNNYYDREPLEAPVSRSKPLGGRCPQCLIYDVVEGCSRPVSKGLVVCPACAKNFSRNL